MEYLDLPEEVIEAYILPKLPWNDLLRHRRVCKRTQEITDGYLRLHPELAPELEIEEGREDRSFEAFMEMAIPTTQISLRNNESGNAFYAPLEEFGVMAQWLKEYGPIIEHLRVTQVSFMVYGKERKFLESLGKLKTLEAERFGENAWHEYVEEKKDHEKMTAYPLNFRKLQGLSIGELQKEAELPPVPSVCNWTYCLMRECSGLLWAALPYETDWDPADSLYPYLEDSDHSMSAIFNVIIAHILGRDGFYPQEPNLKVFDFTYFHGFRGIPVADLRVQYIGSIAFLRLCEVCLEKGVKLQNVGALWFVFRATEGLQQFQDPDLGLAVASLMNIHPFCFPMNLGNLEKITIEATSKSTVGGVVPAPAERPDWPKLKAVDITVDSKLSTLPMSYNRNDHGGITGAFYETYPTRYVFRFLFQGMNRPWMVELRLNFANEELDSMCIPKEGEIVAACPNLKKLSIVNWPGTNRALTTLFQGLKKLEEINLESCRNLGNVAFVGLDVADPILLKLKNLKKLSLRGLDRMPKVTDLSFTLVIRHLPLSHLILSSDAPLNNVTTAGIQALLDGPFASKIEKFPFENWSLANVSEKEFMGLGRKFRSYDML